MNNFIAIILLFIFLFLIAQPKAMSKFIAIVSVAILVFLIVVPMSSVFGKIVFTILIVAFVWTIYSTTQIGSYKWRDSKTRAVLISRSEYLNVTKDCFFEGVSLSASEPIQKPTILYGKEWGYFPQEYLRLHAGNLKEIYRHFFNREMPKEVACQDNTSVAGSLVVCNVDTFESRRVQESDKDLFIILTYL